MNQRRALTASTRRVLCEGSWCPCHQSGSTACCHRCDDRCGLSPERITLKALAGMVNKGWPETDCWVALLDPANAGGRFLQHLHTRNAGRARKWLYRQYEVTTRWVLANPVGDRMENIYQLVELKVLMDVPELLSEGRSRVTDRTVLRYLIDKGLSEGTPLVRSSYHQIELAVYMQPRTVHACLDRLTRLGWISVADASTAYRGTTYRLHKPAGTSAVGGSIPRANAVEGASTTALVPAEVPRLFGTQGLGLRALEVYCALRAETFLFRGHLIAWGTWLPGEVVVRPKGGFDLPPAGTPGWTAADLAAFYGSSVETMRRALNRLSEVGLAHKEDAGWYRYEADFDRVAEVLNVTDTKAIRQLRQSLERDGFYDFLTTPKGRAIYGTRGLKTMDVAGERIFFESDQDGVVVERHRRRLRATEVPDEPKDATA